MVLKWVFISDTKEHSTCSCIVFIGRQISTNVELYSEDSLEMAGHSVMTLGSDSGQ